MFYYAGVSPNPPRLRYRSDSQTRPFTMPKPPEAYRRLKQARGVFGHPLNAIWKLNVGPKIRDLLQKLRMEWTSIDVVRFLTDTDDGKKTMGPVVIWVGVVPGLVEGKDAHNAANDILDILKSSNIHDVEVEFRDSLYHRYVGPALLKSVSDFHKTADVRGPLTPALGIPIATAERPDAQGTMTVLFNEGGQSNKLLGLTCHRVVLKVDKTRNEDYTLCGAGAPRKNVLLMGECAFDTLLDSIRVRIGRHSIMVDHHKEDIKRFEATQASNDNDDVAEAQRALPKVRSSLTDAEEAIEELNEFYETVNREWSPASQRIIGHIRRSPPIIFDAQPGGFTEDWAVIELDASKFQHFKGNFIDLGTEMTRDLFVLKMNPRFDARSSFKYPVDRLLPLRGMITEELLRKPDMPDMDGQMCLFVIKNGNATGVTIGRATGMESFVRDHITNETSMEWAVYNYSNKSGVFSAKGDSGSMVADGLGRMGGILHAGAGMTMSSDVTYITPMCWAWPRIQAIFPNANLYP